MPFKLIRAKSRVGPESVDCGRRGTSLTVGVSPRLSWLGWGFVKGSFLLGVGPHPDTPPGIRGTRGGNFLPIVVPESGLGIVEMDHPLHPSL